MGETLSAGAAFMLGFLGSTHCLGMCGGIMSVLSLNTQKHSAHSLIVILLSYNSGRIISYMAAGICVSLLGLWLQGLHSSIGLTLRIISASLLILMGFYLTGWWRVLTLLEQAGEKLWKHIQPLGTRLMPVSSLYHAFLLGLIWGWLPCGLVYSVLSWSAITGNIVESAIIMLFFGLGTLPTLMTTGLLAKQLHEVVRKKAVRIGSGLLIIAFGLWMLWGTITYMANHSTHINPDHNRADDRQTEHHHH